MPGSGLDDIFLAYPIVGEDKARRLLALSDRIQLKVGVDSVEGAASLSAPFHAARRRLSVSLKIDCGFHRVGVAPERPAIAAALPSFPVSRFDGVFTHAGHGYGGQTPEAVAETGSNEGRIVREVADALRAAGLAIEDVSLGSTPTARHSWSPPASRSAGQAPTSFTTSRRSPSAPAP